MSNDQPAGETVPEASTNPEKRVSGRGLLKSTSVVSAMTLLSRILGLVRDIVFARFFGASIVSDAFFVANKIPNMLRRFSAEGAFSQGFVPVMARYKENNDHDESREFIDAVAGTFGLILFVVTLIGVIAAPILVLIVAPGFIDGDGRFDLATAMLRFTFPYLLFISLTACAAGILNTYGKFAAPAFTPVILNVILIGCAIWVAPLLDEPGMALAYGVFVAGLIQLLFLIPFLAKVHAVPRPRWQPKHDGVRRVGKLMLPAIFGSSVAQVNVLIGSVIASMLGVGKISYLYYSDRLMEFPLGLFGIALATVMLPVLSKQAANRSLEEFSRTIDWSMKLVVIIAVPAAVGLIALAKPLMVTLFHGEVFTLFDVEMAAISLQAFALGLIGFSFVKILAPAFFAEEDTKTPVKYGLVALAVNFVLSVASAWYLTEIGYAANHAGLALATSVAAILNAWLLYNGLRHRRRLEHGTGWGLLIGRVLLANGAMAGFLWWSQSSTEWWVEAGMFERILELTVVVVAAAVVYFATLAVLGMRISQFRLDGRS